MVKKIGIKLQIKHKTGTRPPSCGTPLQLTIYETEQVIKSVSQIKRGNMDKSRTVNC